MRRGPGAEPPAVRRPLRMLLAAVGWDLRLQIKYQIVTIAVLVTLAYSLAFRTVPILRTDEVVILFIFSDPTMFGFLFIGALVLFERGQSTLQAIVVTPLSASQYLWSKAVSLTTIALPCGVVMAFAGLGGRLGVLGLAALLAAVVLSSLLFVFIGFAAVARVRSINEYLWVLPMFLVPLNLPFLDFFGIYETPWVYVFPTQASLILFQAAFIPQPMGEMVYAVGFLTLSLGAAFLWARRSFDRYVREGGRR